MPSASIQPSTSSTRSAGMAAKGRDAAQPVEPVPPADAPLLQAQGQQLLGQDVVRLGRRDDRLDVAARPQLDQAGGPQQGLVVGGQEEAVAGRAGPPPGAAHPLEEAGHGGRGVDLDDPVEVADVDAQLQRAGGHDDAVVPAGERLLGLPPLVQAQRAVRDERGDLQRPQLAAQLLDPRPAVAEDQPLLAAVQPRDHLAALSSEPT